MGCAIFFIENNPMKISMIAAISENHIIGNGPDIPWHVKGEQLIFKSLTFNQWLIVGRKTFESMGNLANRKYVVISKSCFKSSDENVAVFPEIDIALEWLSKRTNHAIVSGGGEIYKLLMPLADTIHLSIIKTKAEGDTYFPKIPKEFLLVLEQEFHSNIDYTYQIWQRGTQKEFLETRE